MESTPVRLGGGRSDQWSVSASATVGATATARDATKSQVFIGQGGADNFTGGNFSDVIMAGGGNDALVGGGSYDLLYGGADNDSLDGGTGSDNLYGGAGTDIYLFSGNWGGDTIIDDAAGQGSIKVDGVTLQGGKCVTGMDGVWPSSNRHKRGCKWDCLPRVASRLPRATRTERRCNEPL